MSEQLTVSQEFLQRALGFGEGGDPQTVAVLPDALPDDFPLTLPELPGLRVLGSVRSVAPRWTFQYPQGAEDRPPEQRLWRAFLDVALPLAETMSRFQAALRAGGWQAVQPFAQTFVEAEQSQWMAVHPERVQQFSVQVRQQGDLTQVWLNVHDSDARQIGHLLGRHDDPAFQSQEAPLPTLTLPPGWRAQLQQGSGRAVRSEEYGLRASGDAAGPDLLPHLLPQLQEQGWQLLQHEGEVSVYRTAQGVGTLLLTPGEGGTQAVIVHATTYSGRRGAGASFGV